MREELNDYYKNKQKRIREDAPLLNTFYLVMFVLIILLLAASGLMAANQDNSKSYTVYKANISAYCPCEKCCGKWAKVLPRGTASGHIIKKGDKFIAAPKNIPFGTIIDVPGYGKATVLDRGGAIKGNKLDLYFESHKEALQWGRKQLTVKVYKEVKTCK